MTGLDNLPEKILSLDGQLVEIRNTINKVKERVVALEEMRGGDDFRTNTCLRDEERRMQ